MNGPLISIVLPIYNISRAYLNECVLSLCQQTYRNIEILLINDGSQNDVDAVCREWLNKDDRIIYLPIRHQGVSVARNTGIEYAKGEYIAFVDPDDYAEKEYIEKLYEVIIQDHSDISMSACIVNYPDKKVSNPFLPYEHIVLQKERKNEVLYQLFGKKICRYYPPEIAAGVPWCKLFKTSFIKDNHLTYVPGLRRMQDNIFCLYAFEKAEKISYIQDSSYHYRMDYSSASHGYRPTIIRDFESYYEEAERFLDLHHKEKILYDALKMKELTSFNSYFSFCYFHPDCPNDYLTSRKEVMELLDREPYASSLKSIDRSVLNRSESLFVFLLKHRCIYIAKTLVKIRNRIKMK